MGAVCGILAPIIFLIFYLTAWSLSPWYDFGGDYLSDLGVGEGAWAYNTGVVIAGLLAAPFAIAIWKILPSSWLAKLGSIFCAAAGISLMGVGIVTEHQEGHLEISIAFFFLALLFGSFLALPLIRFPKTSFVGYLVTLTLIVTVVAVAILGFNPLSETIAVIEILIWVLIVSFQILLVTVKEGEHPIDS